MINQAPEQAAEKRQSEVVLVTGMVIGTILTLFVVPAVYMALARKDRRRE